MDWLQLPGIAKQVLFWTDICLRSKVQIPVVCTTDFTRTVII